MIPEINLFLKIVINIYKYKFTLKCFSCEVTNESLKFVTNKTPDWPVLCSFTGVNNNTQWASATTVSPKI